ncbi:hypothetical protein niasHT_003570 [Heterodera trifolii]|uniref:Protein kinase domain-containing protein n=1 Tax=Heterodera trifolii TaxID=157864 RepID=A0ABD2M637_9BILA
MEIVNSEKKKCRNFQISEMEPIEYKRRVTESEEVLQVKIAITERINSGGSGQIFIGYYTGEVLSSNSQRLPPPKGKCVAIKIYSQQKGYDFIRGVQMLTELKQHENMDKHIVDIMDYGMIEPGQSLHGYLSIFELADLSLFQELEIAGNRRYKSDLITLIKSIMNILVEVHEAAVHLDLKTKNILVFKKRDITNRIVSAVGFSREFSLKLTDFDGSAFVEDGVGETDQPVITPDYTSPELLEQKIYEQPSKKSSSSTGIYANIKKKFLKVPTETKSKTPQGKHVKKVTTKMDIWSAAITIYEIVLINFLNGSWSSNSMPINMADFRLNIENKVKRIGELCRFARLYDGTLNEHQQQMMIIKLDLVVAAIKPGSEDWWLRYSGVVINILDMWGNKYGMPDIAYLLVNMLDIDPTVRMAAKGVIDYLDGKCRPRQITLALFSNVSAEQLDEWLDNEIARLKQIKCNKKDLHYKSIKKIKAKLEKVVEIQKKFLEKLEEIEDECDE